MQKFKSKSFDVSGGLGRSDAARRRSEETLQLARRVLRVLQECARAYYGILSLDQVYKHQQINNQHHTSLCESSTKSLGVYSFWPWSSIWERELKGWQFTTIVFRVLITGGNVYL